MSAEAHGAPADEGVTLLVGGSSSLIEVGEGNLVRSLFLGLLLFFFFFLWEEEEEEVLSPSVSPPGAPLMVDSCLDWLTTVSINFEICANLASNLCSMRSLISSLCDSNSLRVLPSYEEGKNPVELLSYEEWPKSQPMDQ